MRLHGGPLSPFVRKVGICVLEKGIEQRVERLRSPTAMLKANESLMHLNPLSKIPTLETGTHVLFDSDVICEFLDAAFPTPLLFPAVGDERWRALRWNALASGALDMLVLWRFELNRPEQQQSPTALQVYEQKCSATLARIETEMPALQASGFGIGHVAMGCVFGYLDFRFASLGWRKGRPQSAAWFEQFMLRPSAQATMPYEGVYPLAGITPFWKPV
jgi:glutathione S-transferase